MQTISSAAGTRLARAKAIRDEESRRFYHGECANFAPPRDARHEFNRAAEALADELIAQGFHRMESD